MSVGHHRRSGCISRQPLITTMQALQSCVTRRHMRLLSCGLTIGLCLVSVDASAAEPCGGLQLKAGRIIAAQPLTESSATSPEGKECLAAIAKEVNARRLIRSVTVAVRVPDAQRTDGKALALARTLAAALVEAGLPKTRVFALA